MPGSISSRALIVVAVLPQGVAPSGPFDVAVVGAGVVGAAIARDLTLRGASCVLVEAGPDIGAGTSKANTAILHTGFDAKPGTLEARLLPRGYELLSNYATRVGIPVERTGALLVAWTEEQRQALTAIQDAAVQNGYRDTRPVSSEELYRREPALGPGAAGALEIPGEGIICPFTTTLAYATEAVQSGCELVLNSRVTAIDSGERFRLQTARGPIASQYLVNAAGLHSDEVDAMLRPGRFTVTPRRGELIVFDKLARGLVNHILLPVPSEKTKGVLVSPTVYGNLLLGPTADDIRSKEDRATTATGLAALMRDGERIVPGLAEHEVTATYVGLRAATADRDYQLHIEPERRYACAGGIRSTGVSASMAIAERIREGLAGAGLRLAQAPRESRLQMPNIGELAARPYQRGELIAGDPDFGRIVCFCERVTRGELRAATDGPIPPADLDGLRRRTRALMGRCQGFFCGADVASILAQETGQSMAAVLGSPGDERRG
jgi:glycerol-3-phosphate dehydrogenase